MRMSIVLERHPHMWDYCPSKRRNKGSADMRTMENIAKKAELIQALMNCANEVHANLTKKLTAISKAPCHELSWGSDLFELGAQHGALLGLIDMIEHSSKIEWTVDEMKERILQYVVSGARNVGTSRSSSATSNLMKDCVTKVWGDMYEYSGWSWKWFRDAQRADEEFKVWYTADVNARVAAKAVEDSKNEADKREAKRLARIERRANKTL
jgi:hypothetical protein